MSKKRSLTIVGQDRSNSVMTSAQANYRVTSIQAICLVVVPINVMQDELSPYRRHRPPFTATLMNNLYETLKYKLNVKECWAKYFDVMLWATLSGAYISRGNSKEKELWFTTQLVIGVRGRERKKGQLEGQWEWSAMKSLLQRFYWNERARWGGIQGISAPRALSMNQDVKTNTGACAPVSCRKYASHLVPVIDAPDDMESGTRDELIAAVCHM